MAQGCNAEPIAVIDDTHTLQSYLESRARVGYDGAKGNKGSKVHVAVDMLRHLLAVRVTPAKEEDRAQVSSWRKLCKMRLDTMCK